MANDATAASMAAPIGNVLRVTHPMRRSGSIARDVPPRSALKWLGRAERHERRLPFRSCSAQSGTRQGALRWPSSHDTRGYVSTVATTTADSLPVRLKRTLELAYAVEGVVAARVWQWPGRVAVGV